MFHFLVHSVSFVISSAIWLVFTVFNVWMILDCVTHERGSERVIWILIMLFLPYFGAVVYYVFRRAQRIRAYGI
jgi:hypothetical protein